MAYNPNIPQPTDLLSQSQSDILNNFQALGVWVDVDHVDFGAPDEGKHSRVTFPVQAPAPAFLAGEIGLYSFLNTNTTKNELYLVNSSAPQVTTPITASLLSLSPTPGNNVDGWTYLPSGILIKWGSGTANGNTAFLFPVSVNVPAFAGVLSMQVTTYTNNVADSNTFARLSGFTNLGFNVYGSARTTAVAAAAEFQYLAIGY